MKEEEEKQYSLIMTFTIKQTSIDSFNSNNFATAHDSSMSSKIIIEKNSIYCKIITLASNRKNKYKDMLLFN